MRVEGRVFVGGLAGTGLGFAVLASRPSLPVLVIGGVIALAPVPAINAVTATIFHSRVPVSMHGRVFALRSMVARSLDPIGSVAAGFLIAELAVPAMGADAIGGRTLGRLIGSGEARGAALVLLAAAAAMLATAVWMWSNRALRPLDAICAGEGAAAAGPDRVADEGMVAASGAISVHADVTLAT